MELIINMYNLSNEELDKKIAEEIDVFFKETDSEMVLLIDLGVIKGKTKK